MAVDLMGSDLRTYAGLGAAFGIPGLGVVVYTWITVARMLGDLVARKDARLQDERALLLGIYGPMKEQLAQATQLNAQATAELGRIRQARDQLMEWQSRTVEMLLATRLLVHQAEDKAGLPRTEFPPLPQMPGTPAAADPIPAS